MLPFGKKRSIPFIDGMGNGCVFDGPTIDEHFLRGARGFGKMGADRDGAFELMYIRARDAQESICDLFFL